MLESLALSGHVTVSRATSLVWNSTAWGSGLRARLVDCAARGRGLKA
jgi:hypothetical protein